MTRPDGEECAIDAKGILDRIAPILAELTDEEWRAARHYELIHGHPHQAAILYKATILAGLVRGKP